MFKEKAQAIVLKAELKEAQYFAVTGLLNSSFMLEKLKQECFSKRAGNEEERDWYEFSGGKVQDIVICKSFADSLLGKSSEQARQLAGLSKRCSELGRELRALDLRKVFEKRGEAYQQWNSRLPGCVAPHPELGPPFEHADDLRCTFNRACAVHGRIRLEMIALQEEMDWLVYGACGLLADDHPAARVDTEPEPLERGQRPFCLWAQANGDSDFAAQLIPGTWSARRKALWASRLAVIQDNEHISRIEQPAYKRRWDEQWKVGTQWRSGAVAYAAEFVEAFEWWLREKAEWWLEHRKKGGPAELDDWVVALWNDPRVQAAWLVAAEQASILEDEKAKERDEAGVNEALSHTIPRADLASFARLFKRVIDDETVPEGLPWAISYDELENKRKSKVSARVKSIRGKLNVPRERFHLRSKTTYVWAGLQF